VKKPIHGWMKKIVLLLALCVFTVAAKAEPIKLTNTQADQLLAALLSIDAGLTASNTTIAADDINSLKPKVEAYGKGQQAAQKRHKLDAKMTVLDPEFVAYQAEAEANQNNEITVELTRFKLTDDEITASKIKPATLAVLRQYLLPGEPKK